MKVYYLFLFLLISVTQSIGQFQKGTIGAFMNTTLDYDLKDEYVFLPKFNGATQVDLYYMLSDKIRFDFRLTHAKRTIQSSIDVSEQLFYTNTQAGVGARWYFFPSKVYPFIGADIQQRWLKYGGNLSSAAIPFTNYTRLNFDVKAGFDVPLNENVILHTALSIPVWQNTSDNNSFNYVLLNSGFQFYFTNQNNISISETTNFIAKGNLITSSSFRLTGQDTGKSASLITDSEYFWNTRWSSTLDLNLDFVEFPRSTSFRTRLIAGMARWWTLGEVFYLKTGAALGIDQQRAFFSSAGSRSIFNTIFLPIEIAVYWNKAISSTAFGINANLQYDNNPFGFTRSVYNEEDLTLFLNYRRFLNDHIFVKTNLNYSLQNRFDFFLNPTSSIFENYVFNDSRLQASIGIGFMLNFRKK